MYSTANAAGKAGQALKPVLQEHANTPINVGYNIERRDIALADEDFNRVLTVFALKLILWILNYLACRLIVKLYSKQKNFS